MTRRWFRDVMDQRLEDEATERKNALRKIAEIVRIKTPEEIEMLGISDKQIDELYIAQIREILNECV